MLDIDDDTLNLLILPILCGGHALLYGMIGTAKTSAVMALAQILDLKSGICQCHPETVPGDMVGYEMYNQETKKFEVRRGPVFESEVFLADEINRMPPRSQAALLGPMAHGKATIGSNELNVSEHFTAFATQNPVEMQGVYRLPEAQIDRFMFQIPIGYHSYEGMTKLLEYSNAADTQDRIRKLPKVLTRADVRQARQDVKNVTLGGMKRWIKAAYLCCCPTKQVGRRAPRPDWSAPELTNQCVRMGVSPRALIDLAQAARGLAYLSAHNGGGGVTKDHIRKLAKPTFRHRLVLNRTLPEKYRGYMEADQADMFIDDVLNSHWAEVHSKLPREADE